MSSGVKPGVWLVLKLYAFGVGQNETTSPVMVRPDTASWNIKRLDGVAFTFQIGGDEIECHAEETNNVLTTDPSGPSIANDAEHFRPEMTVIGGASLLSHVAERLAREATGYEGNASVSCSIDIAYIPQSWHIRPVLRQNTTAERIDLHLRDGTESGPLSGQIDPANPGK